jgi:hypothetical protein
MILHVHYNRLPCSVVGRFNMTESAHRWGLVEMFNDVHEDVYYPNSLFRLLYIYIFFFFVVQQTNSGLGRLVVEVSR